MNPLYIPILRGKKGEFTALAGLSKNAVKRIVPLIEIPNRKANQTASDHLTDVAENIALHYSGRPILLDIHQWRPDSKTEHGEHALAYLKGRLQELDVSVNPVIGYDRWDDPEYQEAIKGLELKGDQRFCLRLEAEAVEDMKDPEYFKERIASIVNGLTIPLGGYYVLVDLADISHVSVSDILSDATFAVRVLKQHGFRNIAVAGSSMPPSITSVIRAINSAGYISRKEMIAWKSLLADDSSLIFSDYGIRNPKSVDDVIAPNINGKIRYTIENRHFVVRGHSMQIPPKGAQNYALAQTVMDSGHYMGAAFSWGDQRIQDCSERKLRGNSTDWIAIDTNHHVHAVVAEVYEYQRQLIKKTV